MTFTAPIALLIPALIGTLAAALAWPRPQFPRAISQGKGMPQNLSAASLPAAMSGPGAFAAGEGLFIAFLGWPLGWGITAAVYFVGSLVFDRPAGPSAVAESGVLIILGWLVARRPRGSFRAKERELTWLTAALLTLFVQLAVASLVVSIRAAQVEPYGSWDGWAIWNLHARFIDRGQTAWPALLRSPAIAWTHPDYPFLVPASVARLWGWVGHETPSGAAAVSLLFGIGTAGLLVAALHRRRGPVTALLAGIALLGTPFFVTFASNEHADIPLGLFFLATCVLLSEPNRPDGPAAAIRTPPYGPANFQGTASASQVPIGFLLLTGATIGLAASVKNEGELFAVVAGAAWLLNARRERLLRVSAGPFLAGLLLALLPLFFFKWRLAPANDLAGSHPLSRLSQLFEPARHRLIWSALGRDLPGFGQWRWVPFFPLALALVGPGWRRLAAREWSIAAVLLLTFAGYYAVYLLSPFNLQWHLDSSLVRLLLQLWPAALFFWGLAAAPAPLAVTARPAAAPQRASFWALGAVNGALALALLLHFERQLAPNELAATRFHSVHAVPASDWYPAETNGRSRWIWSSGTSTLHLVASRGEWVRLHFSARGLRPQHLAIRQNGKLLWSAPLDLRLARFVLPPLTAPADLVFSSDQPGTAESGDSRSRTLAFALYDLRIE